MAIKNAYTRVAAQRSVSEIQEILSEHGAVSVAIINTNRVPTEIRFMLPTEAGEQEFAVVADIDGVLRSINRSAKARVVPLNWENDREKAVDVAWRIARDWIAATCALIEAGLADPRQAFLGYLQVRGRPLYELLAEQRFLALPPGREEAQ